MSFDRLAPHYTWMEVVLAGRRLQRVRTAWLDSLEGCRDILIAGVGHGHFLRRCIERFPGARITSVDASGGMLQRAERRARRGRPNAAGLRFVHARLPDWSPGPGQFDAIVTHFFLDCFPPDELARVIAALAGGARPNARWLLSDFTVPARGVARQRARAVHALMYAFFRPLAGVRARRVTDPAGHLRAAGFSLTRRTTANWGLLHSDVWERPARS